jgi:amidase
MTNPVPIEELTIERAQVGYWSGEFTVRDVVAAYLDRIDRIDRSGARLNSIINVSGSALAEADRQDALLAATGTLVGPLHGVPVVVKDQVETHDLPTTFGSKAAAHYQPNRDATALARLRAAGAIILGKTTMPDFATSWFSTSSQSGLTKNPYDLSRDAGGSSSGTASAVAANLALVGIGEDTGGSIRLPSSFCNLVGVRVTPGLISRAGMSSLVETQDTAGPMTRTVQDAARLLDVLVGYDPEDPYTAAFVVGGQVTDYHAAVEQGGGLAGTRIGVLREAFPAPDDTEGGAVADVIEDALSAMAAAGAELVDVEIKNLQHLVAFTSVYYSRSLQDMNAFLKSRPNIGIESIQKLYASGDYHPKLDLLEGIATGPASLTEDPEYLARMFAQGEFQRAVIKLMQEHRLDAIAFPDSRLPAPTHDDVLGDRWTCLTYPTNTVIASQLLFPAITVPAGFTTQGLPVGLELMAPPFAERTLLRLAAGVEASVAGRRAPKLSVPGPESN